MNLQGIEEKHRFCLSVSLVNDLYPETDCIFMIFCDLGCMWQIFVENAVRIRAQQKIENSAKI